MVELSLGNGVVVAFRNNIFANPDAFIRSIAEEGSRGMAQGRVAR